MANLLTQLTTSASTVVSTVDTAFTAVDNASSVIRSYSTEWAQRAKHEAKANSDIRHAEFLDRCEERIIELSKTQARRAEAPDFAKHKAAGQALLTAARQSRAKFLAEHAPTTE